MSFSIDGFLHTLGSLWTIWCSLLSHRLDWWDPYGATLGAMVLLLFIGVTVKFVTD